jgi:hypothetical protein
MAWLALRAVRIQALAAAAAAKLAGTAAWRVIGTRVPDWMGWSAGGVARRPPPRSKWKFRCHLMCHAWLHSMTR